MLAYYIYIWSFIYVIHYYFYAFVCYFHAYYYIYVIVISTWLWYMTCVLSTLHYLYVISLVLCSFAFASAFILRCKWALLLVLMLNSYPLSTLCWLESYKLTNTFVLIDKSLYEPSSFKNLTLSHTRGGIVINHQKGGDWKHLGP